MTIYAATLALGAGIARRTQPATSDRLVVCHVETEDREGILANGVPSETFIGHFGCRAFDSFAESLALCGTERIIREMDRPRISPRRLAPRHIAARLYPDWRAGSADTDALGARAFTRDGRIGTLEPDNARCGSVPGMRGQSMA